MPGVILRALPASWHMPESMAAHIIGEPTLWDAGVRLMHAGDPDEWKAVTASVDIIYSNREVIKSCARDSIKTKKIIKCIIRVGPQLYN